MYKKFTSCPIYRQHKRSCLTEKVLQIGALIRSLVWFNRKYQTRRHNNKHDVIIDIISVALVMLQWLSSSPAFQLTCTNPVIETKLSLYFIVVRSSSSKTGRFLACFLLELYKSQVSSSVHIRDHHCSGRRHSLSLLYFFIMPEPD